MVNDLSVRECNSRQASARHIRSARSLLSHCVRDRMFGEQDCGRACGLSADVHRRGAAPGRAGDLRCATPWPLERAREHVGLGARRDRGRRRVPGIVLVRGLPHAHLHGNPGALPSAPRRACHRVRSPVGRAADPFRRRVGGRGLQPDRVSGDRSGMERLRTGTSRAHVVLRPTDSPSHRPRYDACGAILEPGPKSGRILCRMRLP